MKQFKSFLEAISYHNNCVICNNKLSLNDRDLVGDFDPNEDKISFYLSGHYDDIVSLNTKTGEASYVAPKYNAGHGTFIHGLTLHCESCCQFAYNIQIHIDLGIKQLIGIFLNSETISIEDKQDLHEIKNVYPFEKTEYSHFSADFSTKNEKRIIMPLMPLNLNNPMETVNRIRNLIIFI